MTRLHNNSNRKISLVFSNVLPTLKDTFVLACQISQVFYATDNNFKGWLVVRKIQPHDLHAMSLHIEDEAENLDHANEVIILMLNLFWLLQYDN